MQLIAEEWRFITSLPTRVIIHLFQRIFGNLNCDQSATNLSNLVKEFEPDWLGNQSDGDSMIGSSIYGASLASTLDRLSLTRNDQLPGVVLQARARLQERLRGISPSGNRLVTQCAIDGAAKLMPF
ncbi:hypothetical protein ZIOFF_016055 [Zingiber officinale]|uniref:Uncharacterized protein n=1 Tax=Zingiber officinale TaxID=94328 RepID=A0A8J5LGA0_ZINOF|nr:hypothetical protein ZIOFF_016055 [Zingiber officinale]